MDSIFTPSSYPLAVSPFDNDELPPCKLLRQRESFSTQSQEVQSPSTDYTETEANFYEPSEHIQTPKLDYENLGHSTQFIQALSTFESIIDSSLQCSFNWEENRKIKQINKDQIRTKEETSDVDTGSECEEDETDEFECWSDKKDKLLKNLAVKCKYDWKKIANKFNKTENSSFTPLALKQKYKKSNQVSIPLRVKFTHQEDLMIAKYFEIYGCDWAQIATHFADRSAMMLKNRYYSFIRKRNLLSSMLEEIKGTCDRDTEVETQSIFSQEVGFYVQDCEDRVIQKFSYNRFNESFFELDLELSAELHDKITPFTL